MKKEKIADEKIKELWSQGLTDREMAQELNLSIITVGNRRRALNLAVNKQKRMTENFYISKEDMENACQKCVSDSELANLLGVGYLTAQKWRKKYKIDIQNYNANPKIELNSKQKQVLFGTLLGDGYLKKTKDDKNAEFSFNHSIKQKEYVEWKYAFFNNFPGRMYEYLREPNKKTGKRYNTFTGKFDTNESFTEFHKLFYNQNNIKHIPIEKLKELYTPLAMAIHYMDDGSCCIKKGSTSEVVSIATCSYTKEELEQFIKFLKEQYDLHWTVGYNNTIHLRAMSVFKFMDLISPYIIPSMSYKLSPKWVKKKNSESLSDNSLPS